MDTGTSRQIKCEFLVENNAKNFKLAAINQYSTFCDIKNAKWYIFNESLVTICYTNCEIIMNCMLVKFLKQALPIKRLESLLDVSGFCDL